MIKLHVSATIGHHQGFSSERIVCYESVYIRHAAAYRCWDLIIEDLELNMVYSLGMEPIEVGSESVGGGALHFMLVSSIFHVVDAIAGYSA